MKLFVKRDISTPDAGFTVFSESGQPKYYVVFKKTYPVIKLEVNNSESLTVAKIRQLPLPAILAYSIGVGNGKNVKLMINKKGDKIGCYYYGINWHISGDICAKTFRIIDVDNTVIATHQKSFSSISDSYEINIFDDKNELLCVTTSVCINLLNTVDNLAVPAV